MLRALLGLANGGIFNNPTFTGVVSGGIRVLAQSFAPVSCPVDITEDTLATITVPANAMGPNGYLRITTWWTFTNNANAKTGRVRFSGVGGQVFASYVLVSQQTAVALCHIFNANATNSQSGALNGGNPGATAFGLLGAAFVTASVDTTANTTVVITGQKATSTDTLTLAGYCVELLHP